MSVTSLHVPYKKEFEPIVLPGENIAIATKLDEKSWEYYKVKYVEPFFLEYTTDVITNGSSLDVTIDQLKLHDEELGQIRLLIQTTGFDIEVKLPEATSKYSTKETVTKLSKWVTDTYPWLAEIFYKGDVIPKLVVYNNSGADGSCTIRIIGFRYILEKLPSKPDKFTIIYVEAVPSPARR